MNQLVGLIVGVLKYKLSSPMQKFKVRGKTALVVKGSQVK
jgi:hypothetical protein